MEAIEQITDLVRDFNTSNVVRWVQRYDPTRLVD
eukprot:SAG31_NODE_44632_length_262_cov_0.625767_1_plen_33_part_01